MIIYAAEVFYLDFNKMYKQKLVTPDDAVKIVKSGDNVQYNSHNGIPPSLDMALARRRDELRGVIINTSITLSPLYTITSDPGGEHFLYDNWHATAHDRKIAQDSGNFYYVPALYYELPITLKKYRPMDMAMMQVSPMDEEGNFNFGPAVAHARDIIEAVDTVVLEVLDIEATSLVGGTFAVVSNDADARRMAHHIINTGQIEVVHLLAGGHADGLRYLTWRQAQTGCRGNRARRIRA